MIKTNKKGLSEIISYVLLIVIALSLAVGIYAWLKTYLPSDKEKENCPSEVSIIVSNYECEKVDESLNLTLQNKGMFSVNGFYIRASNDSTLTPTTILNSPDGLLSPGIVLVPGRYDLKTPLKPQEIINPTFFYNDSKPLKSIEIQPFVKGKNNIFLCEAITRINIDDSNCWN